MFASEIHKRSVDNRFLLQPMFSEFVRTHTHSDTSILPDLNFIPRLHYNMHVYCTCIDLLFLCVSLLAMCNSFGLRTSTVLDDALSFSVVAVWVYLQHAEEPCGRQSR